MTAEKKEALRKYGAQSLSFFKGLAVISDNHTGKLCLELNCNEGNLTNIVVKPEIKA